MAETAPFLFDNHYQLGETLRTENDCLDYLEYVRWGPSGRPICPWTGSDDCYQEKTLDKKDRKVYVSKASRKLTSDGSARKFNVKIGTIFHDAQIEIKQWLSGLTLHLGHKKGLSSHQLACYLGIEQSTAFLMQMKMRGVCGHSDFRATMGQLVQLDEAFFGGKFKNMHEDKKALLRQQGESDNDKTVRNKIPVFGIMDHTGKVFTIVVPDTTKDTLIPIIKQKVEEGSIIVSDEWKAYNPLAKENFFHFKVNHSAQKYVVADPDAAELAIDDFAGKLHNNSIEGHWGQLKRSYVGTYHHISPQHLPYYLLEWDFRTNTRNMSPGKQLNYFLSHCEYNPFHKPFMENKKKEGLLLRYLNEYKDDSQYSLKADKSTIAILH